MIYIFFLIENKITSFIQVKRKYFILITSKPIVILFIKIKIE